MNLFRFASPRHPDLRRVPTVVLLVMALLLSAGAMAATAEPETVASGDPVVLEVFNRDIFTFRSPLMGISARDRAHRARTRIEEQLDGPGDHKVSMQATPLGTLVLIDAATSFMVTAEDVDKLQQETVEVAASKAAAALAEAIEATRESRRLDSVLRSLLIAGIATAVFLALLWVFWRARRGAEDWLVRLTDRHAERLRVSGVDVIHRERLLWFVRILVMAAHWFVSLLLFYEWISLVLRQFPYTRIWGERLTGFLLGIVKGIATSILHAVPGIVTAIVIFLLARFVARMLDGLFARVESGQIRVDWLHADLAVPTRRLVKVALWLFAFAMAYPYLPGAQTDAFKGLSVLVGLMISFGASNLVGQAGSGLILTYARVFRPGEYVRIDDHEGTVMELGLFATRVRTGLGEELTLSNSLVIGSVTKNYSRAVNGPGFVLDTTVTIGYDTPWRQVHALLVEAALRTPGVLATPAPQVFQTALSDFYPEYRLVCQAIPTEPRPRALVLSALHANIQDVFNEYGVQIMSPQYYEDPEIPKVVPKEQWFTAPAIGPDTKG